MKKKIMSYVFMVFMVFMVFCILSFSVFSSYAGKSGYVEKTDVVKYRIAFSVINKIPCNLSLEQAYELNILVNNAIEDAEIISLKNKMKASLELRLTLKEVYKIRNILATASDTIVVLELRTKVTDIISEFKLKLANFKSETSKNDQFITKAEGIVLDEEK